MESPQKAILLVTNHHTGSEIALKILLSTPQIEIVGVIVSPPTKGMAQSWRCFRKMGILLTVLLATQQCIKYLILLLNSLRSTGPRSPYLTTITNTASVNEIPIFNTQDINNPEVLESIDTKKPDLIISAFYSQILPEKILAIPTTGAINIHPGDIEQYRGVMNYFWVLKNGECQTAASVHWMDKGIDTGEIIARVPVPISNGDTQFSITIKTATQGAITLVQQIKHLTRGQFPQIQQHGRYYSLPNGSDLQCYLKERSFFTISELFALLDPIQSSTEHEQNIVS